MSDQIISFKIPPPPDWVKKMVHDFYSHPAIEGRKVVHFSFDEPYGGEVYEGWTNSATWCFSLYFCQSRHWLSELYAIVRKDGKINQHRLLRLLRATQKAEYALNCQVDEWCEGAVNVRDFVEEFFRDYAGGLEFRGFLGE